MIEEYLLIIDMSDFLRLQGGEGAPPLHDHRPFIDPESDFAAVLPPQPLPASSSTNTRQFILSVQTKKVVQSTEKPYNFLFVWQTSKSTSMISFKTIELFVKTNN
jgi:hypothetical protein